MNIYNFLQLERAPKLDLHVHLQGSGNLHVMNYLINKNKLTVRAQILHDKKLNIRIQQYSELMSVLLAEKTTISDITSLFDYRTTDQFFTTYKFLNLFINSISDLDLYIKGVVIKLIKQNIVCLCNPAGGYISWEIDSPLIQACFSPPIEVGVISQLIYIVNKERYICYARYTRG